MVLKKVLIQREKKRFVEDLNREFTIAKQRFYNISSTSQDFHTKDGIIAKKDLAKKDGSLIKSNNNQEFFVFSPSFIDYYKNIGRGAQIIPLKDIGIILAETGIDKNSTVVDAGAGSGALCCFLAHLAKQVTSYELREDFFEIVQKNKELLGLDNLEIKNKNVYEGIDEKDVDLITFDLPEPWLALDAAFKALKVGGFLVVYNPSVPQIMDFNKELKKHGGFAYLKTIEIIERNWEVEDRKVRPKSQAIGHSGFLVFSRKVSNK